MLVILDEREVAGSRNHLERQQTGELRTEQKLSGGNEQRADHGFFHCG